METSEQLKEIVRQQYAKVASELGDADGCCGAACGCSTIDEAVMAEDYAQLKGYVPEADLGLGCGLPTEFAAIKEGDVVVDLGSGAGNDAFVARSIVGTAGRVIGIDFTSEMIDRSRKNANKLGYDNVDFRQGDIEDMPIANSVADVVVSNCVLNLVPDKAKAFSETFRILKPGGHFSVSDIVLKGELPSALRASAEMYAGCVSGAIQMEEYLSIVSNAGFTGLKVQKERKITIPVEILSVYLSEHELKKYRSGESGIYSITLYAEKPNKGEKKSCCDPGCCSN